jgi:hypothetical protein
MRASDETKDRIVKPPIKIATLEEDGMPPKRWDLALTRIIEWGTFGMGRLRERHKRKDAKSASAARETDSWSTKEMLRHTMEGSIGLVSVARRGIFSIERGAAAVFRGMEGSNDRSVSRMQRDVGRNWLGTAAYNSFPVI